VPEACRAKVTRQARRVRAPSSAVASARGVLPSGAPARPPRWEYKPRATGQARPGISRPVPTGAILAEKCPTEQACQMSVAGRGPGNMYHYRRPGIIDKLGNLSAGGES